MKKREDVILVGVLEPGAAIEFRHIENTLEAFQDLVGGYIETLLGLDGNIITICNEEGRLLGLAENVCGLVGPLVFCRMRGEEFSSLSFADVVGLRGLFGEAAREEKHNGQKNT